MAYSDVRGLSRFNAVSVGGAFLINGVMLAGFVLLKPDILPGYIYTPIELIDVKPEEPIKPEPQAIEDKQPTEIAIKLPQTLPPPPLPPFENDFTIRDSGTTTTGTGTTFIPDPLPLPIEPVIRGARLDPRYAGALQPAYPPGAIRNGLEGLVTVKVLIGTDGRVKDVQLLRADEDDFVAATRKQAMSKWRFLPATRDGVAIESWREMTVRFVLPKSR